MEELLPHGEGRLADVLLAALQPRQVSDADRLPALAQELQRVQAGPQVLLCLVAQCDECLQINIRLSSDALSCHERWQISHN